ncbi:arabinofuranosyltransferase [Rhodococcus sp. IEGM 1408]|uniref:arabinofuranosyltransferase n=1 Tax=Rhodococcus sp. IEGM 1408 TaxID=3082220 RepID=UPI00295309AD|nr:arabinofuranosyltransferase [Rhodococcus sp. IEGM 1408]MDV8002292.1 arabinofuranosyltransferase [Rhodococcus sp. IEGM 1408]
MTAPRLPARGAVETTARGAAEHLARRAAELLAALVVAALVGTLTLAAVSAWPFPEPSWLPETAGATLAAAFVILAGWLLLRRGGGGGRGGREHGRGKHGRGKHARTGSRGRGTSERGLWLLGTAGPAFLASSHLGLLLSGTPHYLFGLGGDQLNRVAYVTRFADSPALDDPFYADAAPFYPPQWFWVGGQLARIAAVDGWLAYKPYAILTMAIAGAIAFVAWRWLVPTRLAVLFGLLTAVIGGHTNAYEPYSWILICLLPQVVVATFLLCARAAARAHDPEGGQPTWPLVVTIGLYLGWAALGYTLIAGFAALMVGLVVVVHLRRFRADRAVAWALLARLAAMAAISVALALVFWHRFLLAVLGGAGTEPSVANDFAPEVGSRWPLPMFDVSAVGLLCLIGVVWVVVTVWPGGAGRLADRGAAAVTTRIGTSEVGGGAGDVSLRPTNDDDDDEATFATPGWPLPAPDRAVVLAQALGLMVVAVLGWFALSGLRAVAGSTLLPFRMIPVITLALALAGVVGALALARWAIGTSPVAGPAASRGRVAAVAVVLAGLAAIQMVQHVSEEDSHFAAVAREAPAPPTDVLEAIDQMTGGREPSELVVLTSDPALYAYRPYFTFQAPAQAYATPAARYTERLEEIRRWSGADSPGQLAAALDSGAFRAPDVLVLTREGSRRWVLPVLINTMPLESNNAREEIVFRPRQFDDPALFDVREVGSRMVIVRR